MHELNRPYQQETYNHILNSTKKFIILQAPTGSGKSAFAGQLAEDGEKVITLTRTKALQNQYQDSYQFTVLYGKGNYVCHNYQNNKPGKLTKADLCEIDKSQYHLCRANCPYPIAREEFLADEAGSLNYSKFLLDSPLVDAFSPNWLILDEAHELSDIVTDYSGLTVWYDGVNLLPLDLWDNRFPQPVAYRKALDWLYLLQDDLEQNKPLHPSKGGDARQYRRWSRLSENVSSTVRLMNDAPDCWFIHTNEKRLMVRPLTARFHFEKLFDKADRILLMSATIGRIDNFVRELGIKDYEYIEVPNIWPAPLRRIEDLKGPRLSYRSSPEDRDRHARLIIDRINGCPDDWSGIILCPSKSLSFDLADRLYQTGRPIHISEDGVPTEQVAENWRSFYQFNDGAIMVSWNLWEGADLGDNQICIVAKAPFVDFSDPYDAARFEFDKGGGLQRVANKLVQGLGRVRRGHSSHYGNNKLVAIADSNWSRLRNFMSRDVVESIF
jgi:Rad3-related DNA helicase